MAEEAPRGLRPLIAALLAGLSVLVSTPAAANPVPAPEVSVSDEWEIAVFLCTPTTYGCHKRAATAKQKQALRTFLESRPELSGVRFVDRASAYESFRHDFAGNKALLKAVRAKDLPESFRLRVKKGADRDRLWLAVNRRPGVGKIVDQAEIYGDPQAMASEWDISVFMCVKESAMPACLSGRGKANGRIATLKEKKAVVKAIEGTPGVETYIFEDQATAYRNFVESYADNESLVSAVNLSDIPESYRLRMRPEVDWNAVSRRLARLPGVSQVYNLRCTAAQLKLLAEYGRRDLPDSKVCAPRR
ncbi:permease-like cell division protein FtsX [Nonomuraea sp. NPDC050451]|uniref:permease-like cell division protein FtsX n=1 Tax=Nonomuraea sp. NPDC050451 TaxID=3364364 RepID=UPI0037BBD3E6